MDKYAANRDGTLLERDLKSEVAWTWTGGCDWRRLQMTCTVQEEPECVELLDTASSRCSKLMECTLTNNCSTIMPRKNSMYSFMVWMTSFRTECSKDTTGLRGHKSKKLIFGRKISRD